MKIAVASSGALTVTGVPSSVKTPDDWTDLFLAHWPTLKHTLFSTPVSFPTLAQSRARLGDNVLRCLLLVIQGTTLTPDFYPEDPEQVVNVALPPNSTWATVPILRKYVNARLKNVFDPEYLVLLWSKQLENFDVNDSALLPTYPKDLYNRPFRPPEIRDVVFQLRFRWQVENVQKTLEVASPSIAALVDDPFGYEVLETVYEILTTTDKLAVLQNFKTRYPQTQEWRTGFLFMGMTEPLLRPECLLTEFLLSKFFYLPPGNILDIFAIDLPTQYFLAKIRNDLFRRDEPSSLTTLDLDPKTMAPVEKPQQFWFFDKQVIKRYLESVGKPNYFLFLEQLNRLFRCKA